MKKKMIPLTDEENKSFEKQKVSYINFNTDENDKNAFKLYQKARDHYTLYIIQESLEGCS